MSVNKQLNVSCDFLGDLVCQIPKDVVEVELKVKTKRGKYTLIKDFHTRTEKYHSWDRADHGARVHVRRGRGMPHHDNSNNECKNPISNSTCTNSGTYIPTGKGMGYPPKSFTNPKVSETITHSDTGNDSEVEIPPHIPFIGDYCKTCISKWPRCICKPSSDWEENPIDITQTNNPSNKENNNDKPSSTVGLE